eukprot:4260816-Prymnesium_polylepis.1
MTDLRRTLNILRRGRLEMTPLHLEYPYFPDATLILSRIQLEMGSVNSRGGSRSIGLTSLALAPR